MALSTQKFLFYCSISLDYFTSLFRDKEAVNNVLHSWQHCVWTLVLLLSERLHLVISLNLNMQISWNALKCADFNLKGLYGNSLLNISVTSTFIHRITLSALDSPGFANTPFECTSESRQIQIVVVISKNDVIGKLVTRIFLAVLIIHYHL